MAYYIKNNMDTSLQGLQNLPPPPQGQTGVSLNQLKGLPPPPTGQQGMSLDQVNQPQQPDTNVQTPDYQQDPNGYLQNIVKTFAPVPVTSGTLQGIGNYASRVGQSYMDSTKSIMGNIQSGADQISQGQLQASQGGFMNTVKGAGNIMLGAGKTALNTAGDVAGAAFAPIAPAIQDFISFMNKAGGPLTDKSQAGIIPQGQNPLVDLASSHPEIAHALMSTLNIAGLKGASVAEAPIKQGITDAVESSVAKTANKASEKGLQQATEAATLTSKEMTPTAYKEALRSGEVSPRTNFSSDKPNLPENLKPTVTKFQELLQSKDPIVNHKMVMDKIAETDANVGAFLKTQGTKLADPSKFKTYLLKQLKGIDDISIPTERLATAKQNIVDNFVDSLSKTGKGYDKGTTMEQLWNARKTFDSKIQSAFTGSPTVAKEVQRTLRNSVQDFIASHTSDGAYKGAMQDMTGLFDLAETTETKAAAMRGKSKISQFIKTNPTKAKLIGGAAAAVGGGEIYKLTH